MMPDVSHGAYSVVQIRKLNAVL